MGVCFSLHITFKQFYNRLQKHKYLHIYYYIKLLILKTNYQIAAMCGHTYLTHLLLPQQQNSVKA